MTKEIMKLDQLEKCNLYNLYEIEKVPFYCQNFWGFSYFIHE